MSKHDTDTSDQHAAKRRWLNAHEEGYHKAMGNRQVQMIAIGGAIGTGLFLGAGARLQMAGPALALVYLICGLFSFFILRALGELVLHRPSSGSFVSYAREFLGEKAAYVAGWMYFINWAMTGIVDITAVALYMHYWGAFGGVPQWVFALAALTIVGTMNMIGVKWFAEMEFWFALILVVCLMKNDLLISIGLGKIFGFTFAENFNYPYISRSVTEFWRRWHMSLGSWFRDYVYIPMGGNRVAPARRYLNILVVWMLTGLWHGADWNFVLWGLFFAVFLILEKGFLLKPLQKLPVLSHLYTLLLVAVSFVIFDSAGLSEAAAHLGRMFGAGGVPLATGEALYYLGSYAVTFIIAIIGATPYPTRWMNRLSEGPKTGRVLAVAAPVALMALLAVVTAYLVDGSFNPFLYFRF